jgi:dTDP-4-dehydrorhamnose reductase
MFPDKGIEPRPVHVIGAGGQLGRVLMETSWPAGWRPVGLTRQELDITERDACRRAIAAVAPSLVVNAAAMTAVDGAETEATLAFAVNEAGARNIAHAAVEHRAPLIHLSTDYVFDGTKSAPYVETDGAHPLNVYGRSKRAGEVAVLEASPAHLVVRSSWIFGARGANFARTMLRLAAERDVLRVVADQRGCPTAAPDLAAALARLAELVVAPRGAERPAGILHLAGTGVTTWHGFATAILDVARSRRPGLASRVEPIATADYPTLARRPANSVLDCGKAARFGVSLHRWEEGLRCVLEEILPVRWTA